MKAETCIFFQLAKASQAASRFWGRKVSGLNLTAVQSMVIRFLYDADGLTSREVGERTNLDSATLTGIFDRLEAGDLVERRRNPDDRRSIRIFLTEKGTRTGEVVEGLMAEGNVEFLSEFSESEEVALRSLLSRIRLNK